MMGKKCNWRLNSRFPRFWCFHNILSSYDDRVNPETHNRAMIVRYLTLSGLGAQRPRWPNSQLTIRNLLLYDAETWWLVVFILKAHSDQILAKLINQGGCCCSFVIEMSQKFWKWKKFPLLENCLKLTWGVNFGSRRTILDIKNSFF